MERNTLVYLNILIRKITRSGKDTLTDYESKKIINICREDTKYIEHCYIKLLECLKKNHSQIRYSAVLLCNHLFTTFTDPQLQNYLLINIQEFARYSIGYDNDLPPPKIFSMKLRKLSIQTIHNWYTVFGKINVIVKDLYNYLKNVKHVDFETNEVLTVKEKKKRKKAKLETKKEIEKEMEYLTVDMTRYDEDISCAIKSMNSCFSLLLPDIENYFSVDCSTELKADLENSSLRLSGIISRQQQLEINLRIDKIKIEENENNNSLLENLISYYKLIIKNFLPKTTSWIHILEKNNGNRETVDKVRKMKEKLWGVIKKFQRLKIITKADIENDNLEVSTDSELEEVPDDSKDSMQISMESEFVLSDKAEDKNPEDETNNVKSSMSELDWQDPILLAELKEKTGIDLKMPVKGQKKKTNSEFISLKKLKDTPRQRLINKMKKLK